MNFYELFKNKFRNTKSAIHIYILFYNRFYTVNKLYYQNNHIIYR